MGIYFRESRGYAGADGGYKVLKIFRFGKLIKALYSFGKKIYSPGERRKFYGTYNVILNPEVPGARVWLDGQERRSATYEYEPVGGPGAIVWALNLRDVKRTDTTVSYISGVSWHVEATGYHIQSGYTAEGEVYYGRPKENKTINVTVDMVRLNERDITLIVQNPTDKDLVTVKYVDEASLTEATPTYYDITGPEVTSEGYLKYKATIPINRWVRIDVEAPGYVKQSVRATSDQDRTVTVSLKEYVPEPTYYTKSLTYSPAISANVTSSNSAVTIARPSSVTGGATLTAPAGTVANIFVTPNVSGYASYTFNGVAFNDSLGLSCTLASTVRCRCYTARVQAVPNGSINTIYCYIYPSTQYREQVYVSNNSPVSGNRKYTEFAIYRAGSTAELAPAYALRISPQLATTYPEVLIEMSEDQAVTASNYAPKASHITWARFREGDLVT